MCHPSDWYIIIYDIIRLLILKHQCVSSMLLLSHWTIGSITLTQLLMILHLHITCTAYTVLYCELLHIPDQYLVQFNSSFHLEYIFSIFMIFHILIVKCIYIIISPHLCGSGVFLLLCMKILDAFCYASIKSSGGG